MIRYASTLLCLLLPQAVSSDEYVGSREVLIDNSQVQVMRLTYPPGTESGMHSHSHPNRFVYVVRGGQLAFVSKDGMDTRELQVVDGDAMFVPAATHNVRNIGTTEIILVETEIKE